ncbi:zf-HC2 domain-containing protein [Sporosarcina luteola]|uniref:zf-HC2 domain-containing protein n=1 Tax=Sporosarcina luteola TaxID=582850 RepID=UPI00203A4D54|nr:zf-HC2 domain-containing protein [Sporosarcina luteola]MCM3744857.1 zf-HC2 domain-containing protein [Sporosarcina luteola]
MNTCQESVIHLMHAYLDGDISREEEQVLQKHLVECEHCREMMDELKMAALFLKDTAPVQAPEGFVSGVMARLPKEKSQAGFQRLLRRHPLVAAAALFLLLMSATLFSSYSNNQQFSFTKQPNLVVEGETVVVPAGEVVKGDIVVKNGNLRIEGEVDGNVTVIHGSKYMASTAVVTGKSEEIDQAFDWLWYKIKSTIKDIIPSSDGEQQEE